MTGCGLVPKAAYSLAYKIVICPGQFTNLLKPQLLHFTEHVALSMQQLYFNHLNVKCSCYFLVWYEI